METHSCLSFAVDCGVMFKGIGVVLAGFILFVGSVYMLLAAVFGRWMGYLVLAVAFFGWMTIQSGIWLFGFWSQGPETKTNLGPRGPDSAWIVDSAGLSPGAVHAELSSYPSGEFPEPNTADPLQAADIQAAQGAVTTYLANQANAAGYHPTWFANSISWGFELVLKVAPATVMRDTRLAKAWLARELTGGTRHDA